MVQQIISLFFIVHNIRSLHNVGSLFRTADGAGVKKVFLTGYTPSPFDVFGGLRSEFQKTALGAEKEIAWEQHKNIGMLLRRLKKEKIFVVSLEQSSRSISYKNFFARYGKKLKSFSGVALIVGNEVRGLSPAVLKKSDAIIEIPMRGRKESLNVSVAAGIALFEFTANLV